MANHTPLQVRKARFRENLRRLLKERGWTQAHLARTYDIPLRWIERAYGTGLARRQQRNEPYLLSLLQAFGFKGTNPEALWRKSLVIPANELISDEDEFEQLIEFLRKLHVLYPRKTVKRLSQFVADLGAPLKRMAHEGTSLRSKKGAKKKSIDGIPDDDETDFDDIDDDWQRTTEDSAGSDDEQIASRIEASQRRYDESEKAAMEAWIQSQKKPASPSKLSKGLAGRIKKKASSSNCNAPVGEAGPS